MYYLRKRIPTFLLLFLILTVSCTVVQANKDVFIPEVDYSHYTLDNGLQIYVFEDHKVPLVNCSIWYKVGSINESEGLTGISHFLEHAMFLGTETLEKGQVTELVKSVGGAKNASTGYWRTRYYENLPASCLELAVAIEADRMNNLQISRQEFKREKQVIIQERRKRVENDAISAAYEKIRSAALKNTPLEHEVIGWKEDIEKTSLNDIYNHYKKYYSPNNAILSVAGDVNPEKVYKLARKYFSGYKQKEIEDVKFEYPEQKKEKLLTIRKLTRVPYVIMLYKLPEGNHPDMTAVDFLLDILINNSTSRITTKLRQKQGILLASNASRFRSPVPGYAQVVLIPNLEKNVKKVVREYEKELKKIIENGVSEEEIQIIRKQFMKKLILAQKNMMNFSSTIVSSALKYNNPDFYKTRIKRINSVTEDDIVEAAREYFSNDNRTTGYILPKSQNK